MCTNCGNCTDCGELALPTGQDGASIVSGAYDSNGDIIFTDSNGDTFIVDVPEDDWKVYAVADLVEEPVFTGGAGSTLGNLISTEIINMQYKILTRDTVAIKFSLNMELIVDNTAPSFAEGNFSLSIKYPAFSGSNLFTGTKLITSSVTPVIQTIPVAMDIQVSGGLIKGNHGQASMSASGGNNRLIITTWPELTASGTYNVNAAFTTVEQIA